jgi:hypothetical protein
MAAEERLSCEVVTEMIAKTIEVVAQLVRAFGGGRHRVRRDLTNELFTSAGPGLAVWTGIVPRFLHRLESHGFDASRLGVGP